MAEKKTTKVLTLRYFQDLFQLAKKTVSVIYDWTLHHAIDHIYWFSYTTSCNWSYIDFHTLHHAIDHRYWFSYTTSSTWSYILIFIHYIMHLIIYWFSYTTSCTRSYILIFIHYIMHLIIYIDFHTLHHAIDHIYWFHTLITYASWHILYLYIMHWLSLSWRRPLSYRNQFIDLLCKSMDWFLYDNGLRL